MCFIQFKLVCGYSVNGALHEPQANLFSIRSQLLCVLASQLGQVSGKRSTTSKTNVASLGSTSVEDCDSSSLFCASGGVVVGSGEVCGVVSTNGSFEDGCAESIVAVVETGSCEKLGVGVGAGGVV